MVGLRSLPLGATKRSAIMDAHDGFGTYYRGYPFFEFIIGKGAMLDSFSSKAVYMVRCTTGEP